MGVVADDVGDAAPRGDLGHQGIHRAATEFMASEIKQCTGNIHVRHDVKRGMHPSEKKTLAQRKQEICIEVTKYKEHPNVHRKEHTVENNISLPRGKVRAKAKKSYRT